MEFSSSQAASLRLPDMGESAESYLSSEQEKRLGEEFMRNIRHSLNIIDDPAIEEYIQSLGTRVASGDYSSGHDYTFFVIDDPSVNAFAGPGGYIGIHSGLILTARSEGELASVIAHEVAHVSQRHLARALENTSKMNIPLTAAVIAAIILGNKDSQLGQAALASATARNIQKQINFTRSNEKEADRIGLEILVHAGFDAREMPAFFEQMLKASSADETRYLEFLRTHPLSTSRIADTRNRAEQYPQIDTEDNPSFHLIQARIRSLDISALQHNEDYFKQATDDDFSSHYGYALILMKKNQYPQAKNILEKLIADDPDRITYQIALAETEIALGKIKHGFDIFTHYLKLYPNNHSLTVRYAQALIAQRQAARAIRLLSEHIRTTKPTPALYRLLSEAESSAGNKAQAYQALAEYHYLLGDILAAIRNLKYAVNNVAQNNVNLKLRLQARLGELSAYLKQIEKGEVQP